MIVIGLTGSIGMGKSTVAKMIQDMGIPCHDADASVHKALGVGGAAVEPVARLFAGVIDETTQGPAVNRVRLGQIVFSDAQKLKQLEDILHPLARRESDDFLEECRRKGAFIAVLDIPLLFETGAEKRVDVTINVSAAAEVQKQRVLMRPNMTPEKFNDILQRQISDAEKCKRADYVVYTDVTLEQTRAQLEEVINDIRSKLAS